MDNNTGLFRDRIQRSGFLFNGTFFLFSDHFWPEVFLIHGFFLMEYSRSLQEKAQMSLIFVAPLLLEPNVAQNNDMFLEEF